jgi:hypothetical protein
LYVRNDRANGWMPAKNARSIWKQAQANGKSLDSTVAIWSAQEP